MNQIIKNSLSALTASVLALSALSALPATAFAAGSVTYSNTQAAAVASTDGYEARVTAQAAGQGTDFQSTVTVFSKNESQPFDVMDAYHIDQLANPSGSLDYSFHLGMKPTPGMYIVVVGGTDAVPSQAEYETNVPPPALTPDTGNPTGINLANVGSATSPANTVFKFTPDTADANTPYFLSDSFGMPTAQVLINDGMWTDVPCSFDSGSVAVDIAGALSSGLLAGASSIDANITVSIKAVGFDTAMTAPAVVTLSSGIVPSFTVTFDASGGSPVPGTQTVISGGFASEPTPAPTKTGYTLDGWFAPNATAPFDFANTPVTSDLTLTAKWTLIPVVTYYTVTFDAAGGSPVPASQTVAAGNMAMKPANPVLAGYTLDGWFAPGAATAFDFTTPITSNITLTAKWTPSGVVPPASITMSSTQGTLNVKAGTKLPLQITISPQGADPSVTWSSSNTAVATVDANGVVTAIKTGTARITVKSTVSNVSYIFLIMVNA